jgi:AcrR family transcriptional regulator
MDGRVQGRRDAILSAAAAVFFESGFEAATTAEIARRARTSKRALYALFASKEGMLAALIRDSALQMAAPLELPEPLTTAELLGVLAAFGRRFLSELCDPGRVAMYRLALAEVQRSGHVARELDEQGRRPVSQAMVAMLTRAAERALLPAEDIELVLEVFFGVLTGDEYLRLLLGVVGTPAPELIEKRVRRAVEATRRALACPR